MGGCGNMKKNRKYKVNKPRILLLMSFILLIVVFVYGKNYEKNHKNNDKVLSSPYITMNKNGNVLFEENEFYRKYTISTKKEQKDIKYETKGNSILLYIDKKDIGSLSLKTSKTSAYKTVKVEKSGSKNLIKVITLTNENNFVFKSLDNNKNVVILISKTKTPYKHVVNLDPGNSVSFKGVSEKDITLRIARLAEMSITYDGYKVNLSRENDDVLKAKDVADWSNAKGADILVSIHMASNNNLAYKGFTTYYSDTRPEIAEASQVNSREKLAKAIQEEIVKKDDFQNVGSYKNNAYTVLRYSKMPCAFVQCGFISNEEDSKKLQNDDILKDIGLGIGRGIKNYFNSSK